MSFIPAILEFPFNDQELLRVLRSSDINQLLFRLILIKIEQNKIIQGSDINYPDIERLMAFPVRDNILRIINLMTNLGEFNGIRYFYTPDLFVWTPDLLCLLTFERIFIVSDMIKLTSSIRLDNFVKYLISISCPFASPYWSQLNVIREKKELVDKLIFGLETMVKAKEEIAALPVVEISFALFRDSSLSYPKVLLDRSQDKYFPHISFLSTEFNANFEELVEENTVSAAPDTVRQLTCAKDSRLKFINAESIQAYKVAFNMEFEVDTPDDEHDLAMRRNQDLGSLIKKQLFTNGYRHVVSKKSSLAFMFTVKSLEKERVISIPKLKLIYNQMLIHFSPKEIEHLTNSKIPVEMAELINALD